MRVWLKKRKIKKLEANINACEMYLVNFITCIHSEERKGYVLGALYHAKLELRRLKNDDK